MKKQRPYVLAIAVLATCASGCTAQTSTESIETIPLASTLETTELPVAFDGPLFPREFTYVVATVTNAPTDDVRQLNQAIPDSAERTTIRIVDEDTTTRTVEVETEGSTPSAKTSWNGEICQRDQECGPVLGTCNTASEPVTAADCLGRLSFPGITFDFDLQQPVVRLDPQTVEVSKAPDLPDGYTAASITSATGESLGLVRIEADELLWMSLKRGDNMIVIAERSFVLPPS